MLISKNLKKLLMVIIITLLFIISNNVFSMSKLLLGFKLQPNISTHHGDDSNYDKNTTFIGSSSGNRQEGYVSSKFNLIGIGGTLEYNISNEFWFGAELLVNSRDVKYDYTTYNSSGTTSSTSPDYSLLTLDIPLLIKYRHSSGFYLGTGLLIGLPLSSELKISVSDSTGSGDISFDCKQITNSPLIALPIRIGYMIDMKTFNLAFELGFDYGISKLTKDGTVNATITSGGSSMMIIGNAVEKDRKLMSLNFGASVFFNM